MGEEDVYSKAFADMGSEPLELYEQVGSWGGSRSGAGRKAGTQGAKVKIAITLDPAIVEWLDIEADDRVMSRSEFINQLLDAIRLG